MCVYHEPVLKCSGQAFGSMDLEVISVENLSAAQVYHDSNPKCIIALFQCYVKKERINF